MDNQMQEFEDKLREKLEAIPYPTEQISKRFLENLTNIINASSISDFKCDLKVYEAFVPELGTRHIKSDFNFYEISFLINRIFEIKPHEIVLYGNAFYQLLKDTKEMSKYWNSVVAPIQKKLQVDFKARLVLEAKKNSKIIQSPQLVH